MKSHSIFITSLGYVISFLSGIVLTGILVYDNLDSRLNLAEEHFKNPLPLAVIYSVPHSTNNVMLNGDKVRPEPVEAQHGLWTWIPLGEKKDDQEKRIIGNLRPGNP